MRPSIVVSLILAIFIALGISATAQAAPRMVRVVVLSGQSNMADGWPAPDITAWPQAWYDDSTAAGSPNANWKGINLSTEGGIGVQAGVVDILRAAYPEDQIAVLKVSQGATGISFWSKEGEPGYDALTSRITLAKNRLIAQQTAGEIAGFSFIGFLWMQGENEIDPWNTLGTKLYFEKFHQLASAVRTFTETPNLPIVLGRTSNAYAPSTIREDYGNYRVSPAAQGTRPFAADSEFINSDVKRGEALWEAYSDFVRTSQVGWTLYDARSAWIDVDDLPFTDYYHFPLGDPGKVTIGRRMGRALMRLHGASMVDEIKLDVGPHRWVHPGTHELNAVVTSGPANPASILWTRNVGNSTATLETPTALTTNVTITEPGTYSFQITAIDGTLRQVKTVNFYVLPAGTNLPAYGSSPIFYAPRPGAPVTLTPEIVNPDGDPLTYLWKGTAPFSDPSQIFGRGKALISSNSSATPEVSFSWPGAQIMRLQISDGTVRSDGNASGWINVPVFVGMDTTTLPNYAARWSFSEPTYLLAEISENSQTQVNTGVTQSADAPMSGSSGNFSGSAYLKSSFNSWETTNLFNRPFTNYTVAFWMNPTAPTSGTQVLYKEGGSSDASASSVTIRLSGGELQAAIFQSGNLSTVSTPAPVANTWTHVAFSFDGASATMKLWINGQVVSTVSSLPFSSVLKRNSALSIGARFGQDAFNNTGTTATDFYTGKLDEIRVYERTLDATEISSLYSAGTAVVTPEGTLSLTSITTSILENAASVSLVVQRTIGSEGIATIRYSTSNGSATAGSDFVTANGTLSWADGEAGNKTITIPLLDDTTYEGNETFTLTLADAQGALLGNPSSSLISIVENEVINTPPVITVVTPSGSTSTVASSAARIFLDTIVDDDGLPASLLTTNWTTVSGPATASFGAPSFPDTSVFFPMDGTYILRLTASDGDLMSTKDFTVIAGGTPSSGDGPTSGLILRYKFDETSGTTITDSAPGGNHTTTGVTNATWFPAGKFKGAYDISANEGRAFFPANQADLNFIPNTTAFTISSWVRTASTSAYTTIFAKGDSSPVNNQFRLWSPSAATKFLGFSGNVSSSEYTTSSPALNDTNWHLLTFVNFNSSGTWKTRIYYDANQTLEWNAGTAPAATALMKIGALSTGYNAWTGQLDDFRVYNRALSASEVNELYSASSTNFAPIVSVAPVVNTLSNQVATLNGTITDDLLPIGSVTPRWEKVSGPGQITFGNATLGNTTVMGDAPGSYTLRLYADDGAAVGYADIGFTVLPAPGYETWVAGIAWNGANSAALADPDGDSLSNFLEYAFDGNPLSATTAASPVCQLAALRLQLSFLRARAELTYTVQASSNLSTWNDISYTPGTVGEIQTVTDTVDIDGANPRRFLRLQVSKP